VPGKLIVLSVSVDHAPVNWVGSLSFDAISDLTWSQASIFAGSGAREVRRVTNDPTGLSLRCRDLRPSITSMSPSGRRCNKPADVAETSLAGRIPEGSFRSHPAGHRSDISGGPPAIPARILVLQLDQVSKLSGLR
jgi:hypothetical protein